PVLPATWSQSTTDIGACRLIQSNGGPFMAILSSARRIALALGLATAGATVAALAASGPAQAATGAIQFAGGATAVSNSYIVVLKDARTDVGAAAGQLVRRHGGAVRQTYAAALRGFEVSTSEASARRLAGDPAVAYVEQNHLVELDATQANPPSW